MEQFKDRTLPKASKASKISDYHHPVSILSPAVKIQESLIYPTVSKFFPKAAH